MTSVRLARRDWGATSPKRPQTVMPRAAGVTLHWEGPHMGPYSHTTCVGIVRGIQSSHMTNVKQNWKDIAYNELVCRHGYRFEGRGYGVQSGANGDAEANRGSYSICALVGQRDEITRELLAGITDAVAAYRAHGAGQSLWGHRDHVQTDCPGDDLYRWVKSGGPNKQQTDPKEDDVELTDRLTLDDNEKRVWKVNSMTVEEALLSAVYARRHANDAKKNAAVARRLMETLAKRYLSDEDVQKAVAAGIADALEDGFDVDLNVTPKEQK